MAFARGPTPPPGLARFGPQRVSVLQKRFEARGDRDG
jgi:hypothetical protein